MTSSRGAMVGPTLSVVLLFAAMTSVMAARWDWSGSVSVDQKVLDVENPEKLTNSGTVVEWAIKSTVDVSDHLTANVKLCTSCHGIAVDQAYAEIRAHPLVNLEVGQINVPFGDYYMRHDPANDVLPSKPLPYAMGHMVRFHAEQFNLGVIPMPYSDRGASFFGDVWIKDSIQWWYALYAVNGFRSTVPRDFLFKNQVGDAGFTDNNNDLAFGARLVLAHDIISLGGSYLGGAYDPDLSYDYRAWGLDLALRLGNVQLRSEYLERDTEVLVEERRENLLKKGFYVQAETPVGRHLTFVGRFDGLLREGDPLGTDNDHLSGILRWTLGVNVSPVVDYAFRIDYEYWRFTDFRDISVFHLGAVVAY